MNPIILIIGAPASGKSTIARAIAEKAPKGLHIPVDDLRTMVRGGVTHPQDPAYFSPELIEQLSLARESATSMALRYQRAGFLITVDDFWDPFSHLSEYAPLTERPNAVKVILKPTTDVTIARNHARQSPSTFRDSMDKGIAAVKADLDKHASMLSEQGWHLLDTSANTVDESMQRVLALIERMEEK